MSLKKMVINNTAWLISEKILNLFGLLFITSSLARYIGPDNFGKINFAIYLFGILQTVAIWGSDTICTKRLSKNAASGYVLLKAISKLRLFIFFIISIPFLTYVYLTSDSVIFYFSAAVAASSFFYIQDIYIIINDVSLKSKINVATNSVGLVISLAIRYLIVKLSLDLYFLSIPIILTTLIPFLIRRIIAKREINHARLIFKKEKKYIAYMLSVGFPLVISSVSVAIYCNISRLMLGTLNSMKDLGIYSVAVTLSSAWSFVNTSFVTSMTPGLYSSSTTNKAKNVCANMSQVIILLTIMYFISFLLVGKWLILYLYGDSFVTAYELTIPLIIATGLSSLGMPSSRYIVYHGGYSFLGKKTLIISCLGFIASYLFIMKFGIFGAAYSTLVIELLSLTVLNYFYRGANVFSLHFNIFNLSLLRGLLRK